jgi:hypothetical protein
MLMIYKDLYGIRYVKLQKKVKEWINLSVDSFHHNIRAVRIEFRRWANNILKPLAIDQNNLKKIKEILSIIKNLSIISTF